MNRFVSSLRSHHSLYEPLLTLAYAPWWQNPDRGNPKRRKRKQVVKNRSIMLKYFYNNEIEFLDVDPEFIDLGLKYAQKKALEY